MHCRNLETTGKQSGHHGRDLLIEQDEIAHHHRVVADLLECRVRAQRESRLHRNALDCDAEIGARHADAKHITRLHLSGLAEGLLHGLPVGISGEGS